METERSGVDRDDLADAYHDYRAENELEPAAIRRHHDNANVKNERDCEDDGLANRDTCHNYRAEDE